MPAAAHIRNAVCSSCVPQCIMQCTMHWGITHPLPALTNPAAAALLPYQLSLSACAPLMHLRRSHARFAYHDFC